MADSSGRSPSDPNYDPSTETDPSQSAGTGNPFNSNQSSGSQSQSSSGFGNPYYDMFAGWTQQATGKAPTLADVNQWGTSGFDQNYLNSIHNAIFNSQAAQDYAKSQQNPTPAPATTPTPPQVWNAQNLGSASQADQMTWLTSYLQQHGFGGDDPNYWAGKIGSMNGGWSNPANVQYWMDRIGAGQAGEQPGGAYYENMSAPTAGATAGQTGSQTNLPPDSLGNLFTALMNRSQQSLNVNPSDPIIAGQTNAYNAAQQGQMRQYLSQLAEKQGPYGNAGAETRAANETVGKNTANFQSQLLQNELNNRRTEIQNALTEMGSLLTSNQQLSLQQELAQIDAALKQQQINSGNDQFAATFGLNSAQQAWIHDMIQKGVITG